MTSEAVKNAYRHHWPPAVARGIEALALEPAVAAKNATVTLANGRDVVDLASGGFGYSHPKVLARIKEQIKKMPLSSRMFFSVPLALVLERLAKVTPGNLAVSFFGNAGAEAVEGALKMVRGYHRDRWRFVAAVNGYHGGTTGALSVSGVDQLRNAVSPRRQPLETTFVPYGDIAAMQRAVDERTAAIILEPVQAGFGVVVPPAGYLKAVREQCDKTGALFVLDEVVTCLGVTGAMFGANHDGVAPDIMTLAGALGGGCIAMGGYIATEKVNSKVYDKVDPLLHANTTGGNPTACTAAVAAMDVIEEEGLVARAAAGGRTLEKELGALASKHAEIVSGSAARGFLGSLYFRDRDVATNVHRAAAAAGVLVRLDGLVTNKPVLTLRAPLITSDAELERGLSALSSALDSVGRSKPATRMEAVG